MTRDQMKSFCGEDGLRWCLRKIYGDGPWTCATDTKVAVLVDRNPDWEEAAEDGEKFPPMAGIITPTDFATGEWVRWESSVGKIPPCEKVPCGRCSKGLCECPRCGTGHDCIRCDGTGKLEEFVRHNVFGYDFDNLLLGKFLAIKPVDCRIHDMNGTYKAGNETKKAKGIAMLIRGNGWYGMLMSMLPEVKKN